MTDQATEYGRRVEEIITREFPEEFPQGHIAGVVAVHASSPTFELILDNPTLANWRLLADHVRRGAVEVACRRIPIRVADQERETRINRELAEAARLLPEVTP